MNGAWLIPLLGCTSEPASESTCVPGRATPCACDDGRSGAQACGDDGSWETCDCAGAPPAQDTDEDAGDIDDEDTGEPGSVDRPLQVYLLGGQSNMDGGGLVTGLPPSLQVAQKDVQLFWSGRQLWQGLSPASYWNGYGDEYFGPEVTFGRVVQDATDDATVVVIKHAIGGTSLAQCWAPGEARDDPSQGACYVGFLQTVDRALADLDAAGLPWKIAGMGWMQGESDATREDFAEAYADNLARFIGRVRDDVAAPEMPFSMGLIDCKVHCGWRDTVRAAQQVVAGEDGRVFTVETADLPQIADSLHFDASGMRTLGERLAAALLAEDQPETPQPAFLLDGDFSSHYTGDFIVGYAFRVSSMITVTDLGTLDYAWDGLSTGSAVALWDAETQGLIRRATVPAQVSAGSSIWGGWRFVAIEPVVLEPGLYVIGSQVYSGSDDRYIHNASVAVGAPVEWVEGRHLNGTTLSYPTTVSAGATSWFGPNFLFTED